MRKLPATFYRRDTTIVARELLGKTLCRRLPDGQLLSARIVETEAYLGVDDAAAHSAGGRRTARTEIMYADGGVAYVYLIYGLHFCLNAVTREAGRPEAVLIRAAAPLQGHDYWQAELPHLKPAQWLSGPGRLCRALQIGREENGLSLKSETLWIAEGETVADTAIATGPRIGVDYAGEAASWPLRFFVQGNASVSRG